MDKKPITKEQALAQIAELEKKTNELKAFVEALPPATDHPEEIQAGMVFYNADNDSYYITGAASEGLRLFSLDSGCTWVDTGLFDGSEADFRYIGVSASSIFAPNDRGQRVVLTDAMVLRAAKAYSHYNGGCRDAMRRVLSLALTGRL